MKRLVDEYKCGLSVPYGNILSLKKALLKLSDKRYAQNLGKNGIRAVNENFNFDKEIEKLEKVYNSVQ
jgi:glycosyltransferase involved in cell wall biosynthesis